MLETRDRPTPDRVLQRLEWKVIRRLDGLLQGDYRTLFHGVGTDFADLREYEIGDDIRHIDWNVTARTNHPHVRQYHEERELTAWFLVDRSASMGFGTTSRSKEQLTTELVGTLARLLTRSGNKVGAVLHSDELERIVEPIASRQQVLRLVRHLLEPAPQSGRETDLAVLLRAGLGVARSRSLVVVVSDFISVPGWERLLSDLGRRHELVPIRLVDPTELELPDVGLVTLTDAETGEQLRVDTGDPRLRRRFAEAAREREEALALASARAGVALHSISTEDDLVGAVIGLVESRRLRARR